MGVKQATKHDDEKAVLYIKYDIDAAVAEKIKKASADAKQVIFSLDPDKKNIILVFKMGDESKNLTIIAPIDKNTEMVEEIVKNKEKYSVIIDTINAKEQDEYKDSLEIIVVDKSQLNTYASVRRKNDDYLDMYG